MASITDLNRLAYSMRKDMLDVANRCGTSVHIGGSFSMIDILIVLYKEVLNYKPSDPSWNERDYFILSKGHCVLAYYSILAECGIIDKALMETFQKDGSLLSAHPIMNEELGIESSNGSLGQGISMACGLAKAFKLQNKNNRVYTLIGNGESNEGSVWEAAMSAVQWGLDNLTVIVDNNRLQSDGDSSEIMQRTSMHEKWKGFGFDVHEIDGHDMEKLVSAFDEAYVEGKPRLILANTIKGNGVAFMENNNDWHHNRLTDKLYEQALKELKEHYVGIDR